MIRALFTVTVLGFLTGCGATSAYRPARTMAGELSLRYHDGFEVWSGRGYVAESPGYSGLADFVKCVPDAQVHAAQAERVGSKASVLSTLSVGFAVVGLGGLSGLAFRDDDKGAMAVLLASGVVIEALAVTLGAASYSSRLEANGNAVDAVNYYNDTVGSRGGACR